MGIGKVVETPALRQAVAHTAIAVHLLFNFLLIREQSTIPLKYLEQIQSSLLRRLRSIYSPKGLSSR